MADIVKRGGKKNRKYGRKVRKRGWKFQGPAKHRPDSKKGNYPVKTLFRGTVKAYELKYHTLPTVA